MTLHAAQRNVRAGQREFRVVVVEIGRPVRSRVTACAGRIESGVCVIRIGRSIVVRLVAGNTFQRFIAVGATVMALHTTGREMRPRQRESGGIVVKLRIPICGCVTIIARR